MVRLAGVGVGRWRHPNPYCPPRAAFLRNSSQGRMEVGGQVSPWESQDDTLPLQGLQVQGTPEGAVWGGAGGPPSPRHSPSEAPLRTTEEGAAQDSLSLPFPLSLSIARARTHTRAGDRSSARHQRKERAGRAARCCLKSSEQHPKHPGQALRA